MNTRGRVPEIDLSRQRRVDLTNSLLSRTFERSITKRKAILNFLRHEKKGVYAQTDVTCSAIEPKSQAEAVTDIPSHAGAWFQSMYPLLQKAGRYFKRETSHLTQAIADGVARDEIFLMMIKI